MACSYARRPSGLLLDVLGRFPWDYLMLHATSDGIPCLSFGHLARTSLLWPALRSARTAVDGAPRALSSGARLSLLLLQTLAVIHWYACGLYLLGRTLLEAPGGPRGWLHEEGLTLGGGGHEEWDGWERYVRAFDRALLVIIGEGGAHGDTGEEIAIASAGALVGLILIAYVTSSMVRLPLLSALAIP